MGQRSRGPVATILTAGIPALHHGETNMGDKGSKDKAKKEKQKKAVLSPKEKRKLKNEKNSNH